MDTITFFGAAGGVTGSKHLLDIAGKKVLLDCGTFQGLSDVRSRNRGFPFPPDEIDAVVISHGHMDHCGMLPLLVKRGFQGPIYATPATRDIVERMLEDSAGIERQDAEYRAKHHIGAPDERVPLFTAEDIPIVMSQFVQVPYVRQSKQWKEILPGISIKFYDAGHILGSAITVVKWNGGTLAYSGDVGPLELPLLRDPEVPEEEIDTLLLEATYGGRVHASLDASLERLVTKIKEVCDRGGRMIVPAFSLGRTQGFVYLLHKLVDEGKIPRFPIYVDSPLATDMTEIYRSHWQDYDQETIHDFGEKHTPLAFRNLKYTHSVNESKALNSVVGPLMIVSASGMMTAGRVVHHLRHGISNPKNAVFVTGYQANGTLGRRIIEGAKWVDLYGDRFEVKAEICKFNEFSAHADGPQLADLANRMKGIKTIALVHGESRQATSLEGMLKRTNSNWNIVQPNEGDTLPLE